MMTNQAITQKMLHIDVDLVTVKGLLPFARKNADLDKILIYERTAYSQISR